MKLITLLFLFAAIWACPLHATPTDEAMDAARLTNPEDALLAAMRKVYDSQLVGYQSTGINQEELDMLWDAYATYAKKIATDKELITRIATEYDKRFTEKELKEITDFYSSSAGKKMIQLAGEMKITTDRYMNVTKEKYRPIIVEAIDRITGLMHKRMKGK